MTALPPVPNTIRSELQWGLEGDTTAITRLYWGYSGGTPSAANLSTFASDLSSAFSTNLKSLLNSNYSLAGVVCQDIGSTTGAEGITASPSGGSRSGTVLPNSVAVLCNWSIARRYRGGKPRSYWPLFTVADISNNQSWLSASVTAANTGITAFVAAFVGATAGGITITEHRNVSYYQGFTNVPYGSPQKYRRVPTLRSGGPITDTILLGNVSPKPASQRKRLGR